MMHLGRVSNLETHPQMSRRGFVLDIAALAGSSMFACSELVAQKSQATDKTVVTLLNHLRISRDFTVKVAEAMPEEGYSFRLTREQMSFGEQIVHLSKFDAEVAQGLAKMHAVPPSAPALSKGAVMQYAKACFNFTIGVVETIDAAQLKQQFRTIEGQQTGLNAVLMILEHSAHHRAQAEMYLRAKGVTPPGYML